MRAFSVLKQNEHMEETDSACLSYLVLLKVTLFTQLIFTSEKQPMTFTISHNEDAQNGHREGVLGKDEHRQGKPLAVGRHERMQVWMAKTELRI